MPVNVLKRIGGVMQSIFGIRQRRIRRKVERLKRAVAMVDATEDQEIACEEAGRLMDQYAQMVMQGKDAAAVMPQVKHHLKMCMDCREEFETLLLALRAIADQEGP